MKQKMWLLYFALVAILLLSAVFDIGGGVTIQFSPKKTIESIFQKI